MICGIKPVIHKHIYSYHFLIHSVSNQFLLAKSGTAFLLLLGFHNNKSLSSVSFQQDWID